MAIIGIDHVQLVAPVGGEPAARAFYGELLGLSEVPKPVALAGRGGCWFEAPHVQIHIGIDPDFRPARRSHPALLTDDLAALLARLRSAGITARPNEPIDGYERVDVDDPFGNRIELMQRLA